MLGKVLKYELRAGARQLLPAFGLGLAMAVVLRLLILLSGVIWPTAGSILGGIAGGIGSLVLIAIVVMTCVVAVARFYRSMNGGEGYLTFTLPVKPSTHLMARLLNSTLWVTLSVGVAVLAGFIFIPGFKNSLSTATVNGEAVNLSGYSMPFSTKALLVAAAVVALIITVGISLLQVYAATGLGSQFGSNRVLGSILAYFVINTIESILTLPFILVPMLSVIGRSNADVERWILEFMSPATAAGDPAVFVNRMLLMMGAIVGYVLLVSVLFGIVNYFIARHYYGKKLNLE